MSKLPELSPLFYGDMICSQCGTVMTKRVKTNKRNMAEKVIYGCVNEWSGCSYEVECDHRLSAMQRAVG